MQHIIVFLIVSGCLLLISRRFGKILRRSGMASGCAGSCGACPAQTSPCHPLPGGSACNSRQPCDQTIPPNN